MANYLKSVERDSVSALQAAEKELSALTKSQAWQSTKTAARLMAATTSGKPVLLRLDFDAGHGVGDTKKQQFEERADMYAFLLWQMGVTGFQP